MKIISGIIRNHFYLLIASFLILSCQKEQPVCIDPEIHEDNKGIWVDKGSFPISFYQGNYFKTEDEDYLFMGSLSSNNNCWLYNKTTQDWFCTADFPGSVRYNSSAFSLNGKFYIVGGYNNGNYFNHTYEYNPVSNDWSQIQSLPTVGRSEALAVAVNGYAYLIGGANSNGATYGIYRFDPSTGIWSHVIDISTYMIGSNAVVLDDKIYIYHYNLIQVFNTSDSTMTAIASPIQSGESDYQIIFTNGRYIFMAFRTNNYSNRTCPQNCDKVYRYDPVTETWAMTKKYKSDANFKFNLISSCIGDKIYFIDLPNGKLSQYFL